ncbi:MAG: serine/threonine protein kinase, partial [Bacteroidales bacterium]|nr:serine/threonine protein kinase [Candidatus Latescibacterota bacterium]
MMVGRNYEILGTLATGGTAVLYKAIQNSLGREVVIKKLHSHLTSDTNFTGRFEQEAKTAASLDHENIVRIIDSGLSKNNYFIVMEFIDGITLKDLLEKHGVLDEETVLLIAYEICMGLDHAHQRGIVHRDIKPANIMITREGQVKITDFGLAKLTQSHLEQTVADTLLGTPLYMSPEQAIGEGIDGRSDLFSLGTVCYEMMTATQPFSATNYAAVIQNIINGSVAPISSIKNDTDCESESIVMKAMSRDPGRRFRTALEMARTIEDMLGREKVMDSRRRFRRLVAGQPAYVTPATGTKDNDRISRNTKRSGNRSKRQTKGENRRRAFLPVALAAVMMTVAAVYLAVNPARLETMMTKLRSLRSTSPVSADNGPVISAQGFAGNMPLPVQDDAYGTTVVNPDPAEPSSSHKEAISDSSSMNRDDSISEKIDQEQVKDDPTDDSPDLIQNEDISDSDTGNQDQIDDDPASTDDDPARQETPQPAIVEKPAVEDIFGFIDIQVEPEADILIDGVFRV